MDDVALHFSIGGGLIDLWQLMERLCNDVTVKK